MEMSDNAYAALLGLAIGDAAGMPYEMMNRRKIKEIRNEDEFFAEIPEESFVKRDLVKAEVTDDTLLTMHLANFLIKNKGKFRRDGYFEDLAEYINNNNLITKGIIGPSTGRTIIKITRNENFSLSERAGFSSGLAMKVIPFGIINDFSEQKKILKTIEKLAYYSHYTDTAISAAAGTASIISSALEGKDLASIFTEALEVMREAENYGLNTFQASSYERSKFLLSYLEKFENEDEALDFLSEVMGTGINSFEVFPAALSVFKLFPESAKKAFEEALKLGGDTDTIAALTGAFLGAYNGSEIFEKKWIDELESVNDFNFAKTADKLLKFR